MTDWTKFPEIRREISRRKKRAELYTGPKVQVNTEEQITLHHIKAIMKRGCVFVIGDFTAGYNVDIGRYYITTSIGPVITSDDLVSVILYLIDNATSD